MKLRYLDEVRQEYLDAISYYEQLQPSLGATFVEAIEEAIGLNTRVSRDGVDR